MIFFFSFLMMIFFFSLFSSFSSHAPSVWWSNRAMSSCQGRWTDPTSTPSSRDCISTANLTLYSFSLYVYRLSHSLSLSQFIKGRRGGGRAAAAEKEDKEVKRRKEMRLFVCLCFCVKRITQRRFASSNLALFLPIHLLFIAIDSFFYLIFFFSFWCFFLFSR